MQGIARLIGGTLLKLEFQMIDRLGRSLSGKQDAFCQHSFGGCIPGHSPPRHHLQSWGLPLSQQLGTESLGKGFCRFTRVAIALDALQHGLGPQGHQPFIELSGKLTELGIAAIAETKDGKLQLVQPRRLGSLQVGMQLHGWHGWFALAMGADTENGIGRLAEIWRVVFQKVLQLDHHAGFFEVPSDTLCREQALAGLGAYQDSDLWHGLWRRRGLLPRNRHLVLCP